uniref:TIP41-like protein n=1 Tax=Syphacia muris TaxID=451379 RepID=A0A158R610_9BILA
MLQMKKEILFQEEFIFDTLKIITTSDHILESQCSHDFNNSDNGTCQVCKYNTGLNLPQLPDMIYPNNCLSVSFVNNENYCLNFNPFDALKMVDANNLPGIKVAPSSTWQKSKEALGLLKEPAKPFDWTFTSEYEGTSKGFKIEPTDERIDMEKLKSREPIHFYSQIVLYEDELADHGCSQMTVRVRVMPNFFFLLARFYLRVDEVIVRICDTRVFGERGSHYILREWTERESMYTNLESQVMALENVLDPNVVWQYLPVVKLHSTKLLLPTVVMTSPLLESCN